MAVVCALWVQATVQRLRANVDIKEKNLHDFISLSQGVASSQDPDPDVATVRLRRLLVGRPWRSTFGGLRPQIEEMASGPLLKLVKVNSGSNEQQRRR